MTQILSKLVTFEEFIEWLPNDGKRYELHKRVIVEMPPPTGKHENVTGFLTVQIGFQLLQMGLPYRIPKTAFVKTGDSTYSPDVLLVNHHNLANEPLWEKQSTVIQPESVPLVIEVVSTNWRDDYHDKFGDYEEMGILEYWIVDYAALGGKKFIGNPKQPTIFVCQLIDGEYQMNPFTGNSPIVSPTFPQLNLTAKQIFDSAL
ncbi:MAG: Uma2 family endonuclease [Methylacidiphilales bacterium]|nr:Uma2 family endonuclease [Candidatus Methylacidiphilales bacterium]NJR19915.1 Uma2 family endonuclease [Calothrix sp. CSU_2_0]